MKSIFKNYIYNTLNQLLNVLIPVITIPYISRVLGADGLGTYSFINTVIGYFVMFASFGTATYGSREISYTQADTEKRSKIFWEIELLSVCMTIITLAFFLVFVFFFADNKLLYYICGIQIITVGIDVSWLFSGLEEFKTISIRNCIIKVLCLIGIFLFVKSKSDLWLYVLLAAVIPSIGNVALWFLVHKFVIFTSISDLHPFKHVLGTVRLFIPTIAVQIYLYVDKLMIGIITDSSFENGYYELAVRIVKMIQMFVTSLGTVMMPRIGHLYEEKNQKEIARLIYKSFRIVWLIAIPLCFGIISVSTCLVPVFLGDGYGQVSYLIYILSFIIIIVGLSNILATQYLIPIGNENTFTKITVIGLIVNLVFNSVLIPVYLSKGAAIATVLSEMTILLCELYTVRRTFDIALILRLGKNYFISGCLMFIAVLAVKYLLNNNIVTLLILVFIGCITYFFVLFLFKDSFLFEFIKSKKTHLNTKNDKE